MPRMKKKGTRIGMNPNDKGIKSLDFRIKVSNANRGKPKRPSSEEGQRNRTEGVRRYISSLTEEQKRERTKGIRNRTSNLKRAITFDKKKGANYVYVVKTDLAGGWYKIGVGNVARRIADARTWSPGKVSLVAYGYVPKPYEVEHRAHAHFRSTKHSGEWVKAWPSKIVQYLEVLSGVHFTQGEDLTPPTTTPTPPPMSSPTTATPTHP